MDYWSKFIAYVSCGGFAAGTGFIVCCGQRLCSGNSKDEPAAHYWCFEKCQTTSSSTDSPTVPDIWRTVSVRERSDKENRESWKNLVMKVSLCDVYLEK